MSTVSSVNPATEEVIATYPLMRKDQAFELVEAVQRAGQAWQTTDFERRADCLNKAAHLLEQNAEAWGDLIAHEMGKPRSQGKGEVEKCAWVCRYYAENGADFLKSQPIETDASNSFVSFQPLGTVLAVMPWNFPFWQVFRFAAPALMAGNAFILKHAPNVQGCAQAIITCFEKAGFPRDLCRNLNADNDVVAEVIAHDQVRAVTLTGSTRAGSQVAAIAGKHLKKAVLELGGSDAYVVLDDADIELAAQTCVTSRMINSGQSCIAAKRFIVVSSVLALFEERVHKLMQAKTFGDAFKGDYDIGPMARGDLRDNLHEQVRKSVEAGANLRFGGEIPAGPGFFYPPTLLTGVAPGMPAFDEELFGPVAAIIRANDTEHALELANQSDYGLGAAVFTGDAEKGQKLAEQRLNAGAVFVNEFVKSDPRLPFGGIKKSGYGRELSHFGIREFVNTKTVYVK